MLLLGSATRQVLSGIAGRGVDDGLLHAHILWIDYARLIRHVWIACRGINLLSTWLIHHSGRRIGSRSIHLWRHTVRSGGHIGGHSIILHLSGVDGTTLYGTNIILLGIIARNDIDQKVKDVSLLNSSRNIGSLQRSSFSLFGLSPRAMRKLQDEHFTSLGEKHRSLCGNHANILVAFHNLLDACEWEEVIFEIGSLLDFGHLFDPKGVEFCGELLKIVLLLQLCLTGLLLHDLILSGGHLIVCGGLSGNGWRRGCSGGAGGRGCVIGHGGRRLNMNGQDKFGREV